MAQHVPIVREHDIIHARKLGREMARALGFGSADQTRLATAISELTRNVIHYAGEGECTLEDASDELRLRVVVVVRDHGPGIADVERVLAGGFSTGRGLGAGLSGTQRLVQEFAITTRPGFTEVRIALVRGRTERRAT